MCEVCLVSDAARCSFVCNPQQSPQQLVAGEEVEHAAVVHVIGVERQHACGAMPHLTFGP
eukprot:363603-Chlamydomonas_euryale.AAC.11